MLKKIYNLYRHIRLDKNEVFYIGISKYKERPYSFGRNKYWNSIAKNGYKTDIMLSDLTKEEACQKEIEFIKIYGRKDLGLGTLVNMTDGGEGTSNLLRSDESKRKMSEAQIGNKKGLGHKKTDECKRIIGQYSKIRNTGRISKMKTPKDIENKVIELTNLDYSSRKISKILNLSKTTVLRIRKRNK